MKKIIIDGRGLRLSTGRYTRKHLEYFQKIDSENQYIVLVNKEDESAWEPLKKSTNFSRVTVPYRHYKLNEQLGLWRFLRKQKPDLVHFCMPQQPLLYFGNKITTIHDLIVIRFRNVKKSKLQFVFKQLVFRVFVRIVAHQSKLVLTVSDFAKNDIIRYTKISPDKIIRTHLSADKISASPKSIEELSGKKFLLYVGNAHVHKNLPRAMQAFKILQEKHPDLHFAFAGNKTIHYERLELLADALEDSTTAHVLGFVTDSQLKWLYQNAAVYVFPTLDEGFGLPGLEAMQYDVPVAASNVSCLPEVYRDSVEYFDPMQPADIARGVDAILSNPRHAAALVKRGQKLLTRYSWEKTAKQTHDAYLRALDLK